MGNHESKDSSVAAGAAKKNHDDVVTDSNRSHEDPVPAPTSNSSSRSNGNSQPHPASSSPASGTTRSNTVIADAGGSSGGFETKSLKELGFEFRFTPSDQPGGNADSSPSTRDCADGDAPEPSLVQTLERGIGATRLYRNGTLVTPDLLDTLIPRGNFFDHVSSLCQRATQTRLILDFPMDLVTIYENVQALVSRDLCSVSDGSTPLRRESGGQGTPSDHPVKSDDWEPPSKRYRRTLIVMAGKGISRTGILSVKQLLTGGMEQGSAAYHIHQAIERGWHVIVLDPNAKGPRSGMEVVTKSLDVLLFFDQRAESISNQIGDEIYFLSHSASGGYLVRYLLLQDRQFQRRVAGIAFSDSTHRLSWAANDVHLHAYLQSDRALYVRNNSLGRDYPFPPHQQPHPGQPAKVDHWWTHRYGSLPTVWAGTADHSLVCWTARRVIWAFFDGKTTLECPEEDEGRAEADAGPPKKPS
jgi:hypothetical protein